MANASPFELALLALINDEREAVGLDPLRLNTLLNDAAEAHSQWMLAEDQFSHEGENGSTPGERMEDAGFPFEGQTLAAENIAWQSLRGSEGIDDDVAQVHESLMNSPGHRANILSADAEDIGLGVEVGTFSGDSGDFESVMVTQVFAATDADISAYLDPGTVVPEDDLVVEETPEEADPLVTGDMPDETPDEDNPTVAEETPAEDPEMADPLVAGDTPDDMDEETDPDVVAEETPDPVDETPEEDDPTMVDLPIDDVPSEDETPTSGPDPIASPDVVLPFTSVDFTVDLSEAFEFRQEGDQLIWETSEDALYEAFMGSFETWLANLEQSDDMMDGPDEADQPEDLMADLMLDDQPDNVVSMIDDDTDLMDDLMFSDCA